jgi:DHA2 family multidrug resistance protein
VNANAAFGEIAAAPPANRLMITLAVMSATLIQVLDTTIVNVALPHMQGELGATADQISWVLTSYLVASAIIMPLTGHFTDIWGRRRFLLTCIGGFVAASALCGVAQNLVEIVFFRVLQGVFGAALVPLSQAIMADAYPPHERGKAMAIWGLGVMVGPIAGPTLGGWLTEVGSWRWTFYINLPVGLLSFFLASQFVPDSPRRPRRMDWYGFGFMALGVAGLQYVFDRGNQQDWFDAVDIRFGALAAVVGIAVFIVHSLRHPGRTLFDIRIFRDRNFGMSSLVIALMGLGMFGGLVLQPILMEGLLGYPIVTTGLLMAPRGVATAITMIVVGRLVSRVDARYLVLSGFMFGGLGAYGMTFYSLDVSPFNLVWPTLVQGVGLGLVFVPLSTVAYATLERSRMAEAAGLFSLLRTIGSAVGISIVTTVLAHQSQVIWNELGAHVSAYHSGLVDYLSRLHLGPTDPRGLAVVAREVGRQAQMGAMLDAFKVITWSYVLMAPLVFLLRRSLQRGPAPTPTADH